MESDFRDPHSGYGSAKGTEAGPRLRLVPVGDRSADDVGNSDDDRRDADGPGLRLVREFKGELVDDPAAAEGERDAADPLAELSEELRSVLAAIEQGDLAAAERRLDGTLAAQVAGIADAVGDASTTAAASPIARSRGRASVPRTALLLFALVTVVAVVLWSWWAA
jgi:hypothetical protein